MLEFIQLLNQRYQAIIARQKPDNPQNTLFLQRVEELYFTEAFIRKGNLIKSYPETPLQIAVIGPTQSGKSSISNLILNSQVAAVSPLAGYTVHPQGFCCQSSLQENSALQNYFGRFQQLPLEQLSNQRHDCYSLTVNNPESNLLPKSVFWDTPDFDSIDSEDYREGVIRAIALADIIVLIVSKEKYADQSVWEMMSKIESFHQPTLICINKLIEGSEDIIIGSLKEKWSHARKDACPEIVPLYYQKKSGMPVWPMDKNDLFFQLEKQVSHTRHLDYQHEFINKYWHAWLEPVVAEHESLRLWQSLVDQSINQALLDYQRDYLDHPQHYETFQNALVSLLGLLEIPGISIVLTKTRRILTWPVRKLIGFARKKAELPADQEELILNQVGEHLLISFTEQLLEKIGSESKQNKWWNDVYCQLREQRNGLLDGYQQAVNNYCISFQQDVEDTANRLYNKLSEHPVILNSLRATRVTTDAAALALVIQTGGIGIHDLVITPAMLTITSLLAESVVGKYMGKVEIELKQHQLKTVKEDIFITYLQQALYQLPEQLSDKNRFNITQAQLQQVETQRKEKKHGIRLF